MTVNHDLSNRLDNICADLLSVVTEAELGTPQDWLFIASMKFHLRRLAIVRELFVEKEKDLSRAQTTLDELLDASVASVHPVPIGPAPIIQIEDYR